MSIDIHKDENGYHIEQEFKAQGVSNPTSAQIENVRNKWYSSDRELSSIVRSVK